MRPCTYNLDTKNQLWCSVIADSHDSTCGCKFPFAHLLATIFPPGHQDRNKTIEEILQRDYREQCLSGGDGERGHGILTGIEPSAAAAFLKEEEEEYIKDEDLQNLIDAGEDAAGTR